jgi:regulator of protease activity HflC (stomatin/prohibitin superfamily)
MEKPTRIEVNCTTGEETILELTSAEIAELEQISAQAEVDRAQREAEAQAKAELKASAKAKLIAGQPLTAEEADVLVL